MPLSIANITPAMRKVPPFLLLDAFRGLAALWVVMYHSSMTFLLEHPGYARWPWYALCNIGQLGVVIFFTISGYCIAGAAHGALVSGRGTHRYAADRLRRIYPPYLATVTIAFVVLAVMLTARGYGYEPPTNYYSPPTPESGLFWTATLLLLQVELHQFCLVMVFWTLCYEILFYALIGLFLALARIFSERREMQSAFLFAAIGLTTQASLAWLLISPGTCPFPFDRWYQFGIGAILFQIVAARFAPETEIKSAWTHALGQMGIAVALTAAFALLYRLDDWPGHPSTRMQAATCLIFTLLLWVLFPRERRLAHSRLLFPLMWLGTISYSLYLTHTIVLPFISTGLRRLGFDGNGYMVTSLVFIAVSILGGWIFYLAVERHFISSRQKKRVAEELQEPAAG
ncbi:MAG: acyltransferase [Methylacidiphilales bacterium]|nr:acyltransferase [Candidatus Methylacidiphilales bacterium]